MCSYETRRRTLGSFVLSEFVQLFFEVSTEHISSFDLVERNFFHEPKFHEAHQIRFRGSWCDSRVQLDVFTVKNRPV